MDFISLMEIIGTIAFAVTGALVAIEKDLDYYGIIFLGVVTAVGGGILRDVLIRLEIPKSLANPEFVFISVITCVVVILFYSHIHYLERLITLCDALGLAAFTAIGSLAAIRAGYDSTFIIVTTAMFTGIGGGIIRDVCAGRVPFVFEKEVYAVASMAGALAFAVARQYVPAVLVMYITFGITFALRMISVKLDIHLPKVNKERNLENE